MNNGQKKIKVAFVLGALNHGGAENLILDICRNMDNAAFECVCIYRKDGNLSDAFRRANINMIHVPRKGGLLTYMWQLRQTIIQENIDILHSQTASNTLILGLILLGSRKKIVTTIHSFSFLKANELYKRFVFWVSKKVLFVTNYQMNTYINKYPSRLRDKCQVVYNGIDCKKFQQIYSLPDIYQNSNLLRLCVVGNIRKARTYEVILEAIHLLKLENIQNFNLYIVGNTPAEEQPLLQQYKALCRQYEIDDVVHFVGGRDDVPAILQHSNIYIMSSIETFGISIVEAIMSGIPVVVNDFDVMKEVTEDGKLSLLFKTGDATDLANRIKHVLNNLEDYKRNAKTHAECTIDRYSIENCINQLTKVYLSI